MTSLRLVRKMTSTDLRLERVDGLDDQGLSVDGLFGLLQGAVKTEQRVTQLFELLRDPVYHYLLVIFRSPSEAEDIAQDTFLQLYVKLHRGERIDNARFWVFRVAHNLAINRQKHERVYQQLSEPSWDEVREHLADTSLDPEQLLLREERMLRLHEAMAWLSGQERQCLHLDSHGNTCQGINWGDPLYPAPVTVVEKFSPKPLKVYDGEVLIKTSLIVVNPPTAEEITIRAELRLQACNRESCLPPKNIPIASVVRLRQDKE